ncbi:MAG TPA: hypothetical protein VEU52_07585 [Candidatus Limnocylindrales bacterium]|nr:hypothetical protein [Candidatus Limnocylindrales bacterium]
MSDLQSIKTLVESCSSQLVTVACPLHAKSACITIAKWHKRDGGTTPWVVVDCPLLLAGTVSCDMSCLSQLEPSQQ